MEELGTIKYGNLRFNFNLNEEFLDFIKEKGISQDFFIISSQSFYQAVLFKLEIDHSEKKEIEILFYSINSNDDAVFGKIDKDYEKFENFPAGDFFVDFGAKLKNK